MRWQQKLVTTLVTACMSASLAGCGLMNSFNPAFKNKLNEAKVTPRATFDAKVTNGNLYSQVKVLTADGKTVTLNADKQPILFEAYWCPHCQRTLVLMNTHHSEFKQLPILVSMGFVRGTTLAYAEKLSHEEISQLHLQGMQVYYDLNSDATKYLATVYPTLAFRHQGQLETLAGEHTLQVWQEALNG